MSTWGAVGNIKGPPGTGGGAEVGGLTAIPNGQAYVDVVFPDAQPDANWILRCQVVNLVDAAPLIISPGTVIAKTTTGFRILLSGAPDSANYLLQWGVTEVAPVEATTYTLSGPTGGVVHVASTNFTVALPTGETVPAPVTVAPHDAGGGGTFTPASVVLTSGAPSATFTYTPGTVGAKTISTTNDGALTDPASLTYTAAAATATTYTLTGPSSGTVGVPSTNFTVALPVGTSVPGPVTITPHDAGGGGTFAPTTVSLTTAAPSAQFTYTPASVGAKTISTTNSSTLTDPASLTYTASAATATTYTLTGPSSGSVGVASTNFTVALPGGQTLPAPVTITPGDGGGGGTFTPTTVSLSTGTPSATFTYTPASTGAKTISTTNSSTLTNPAPLTYTVSAGAIPPNSVTSATLKMWIDTSAEAYTDGASVSTMADHSGNGNAIGQPTTAQQPIFHTAVINGRSVMRFDGVNDNVVAGAVITSQPNTVFIFAKLNAPTGVFLFDESTGSSNRQLVATQTGGVIQIYAGTAVTEAAGTDHTGAFHLFKFIFNGASGSASVDTVQVVTGNAGTNGMNSPIFGAGNAISAPMSCDIAEIVIFSGLLSSGDLSGLNTYFHNKYGIP